MGIFDSQSNKFFRQIKFSKLLLKLVNVDSKLNQKCFFEEPAYFHYIIIWGLWEV